MNKKAKRLMIVMAVVVLVVTALSVALRMMLTRDRLVAMIVPRVEKAIDARISVGDMGVRFPFGFGVKVSDLAFEKEMPGAGTLTVYSSKTAVDVSLVSLIRKRPDVQRIDVDGARVGLAGGETRPGIVLDGIRGQFSMEPGDSLYNIVAEMKIGSLSVEKAGSGGSIDLENISISSSIESSFDFGDVNIPKADMIVGDILEAVISANLSDLQGDGDFDISIESSETGASQLLEYARATGIVSFLAEPEAEVQPGGEKGGQPLPIEISAGNVRFRGSARGSKKRPSDAVIGGEVFLSGIEAVHSGLGLPLTVDGDISFDGSKLGCERLTVSTGSSSIVTALSIELDSERRPSRIDIRAEIDALAGDLVRLTGNDSIEAAGKIGGVLTASGSPATFARLVPGGPYELDPVIIGRSWKNIELGGDLSIEGAAFKVVGEPIGISDLGLECEVSDGGLESIKADFEIGGSPWSFSGAARGIFPCAAELLLLSGVGTGDDPVGAKRGVRSVGELLDILTNLPIVSLNLKGRSFDARPFSKPKEGGADGSAIDPGTASSPEQAAGAGSPGGLLGILLVNTNFSASLDSLITDKAIFTAVRSEGAAIRGVLRVREVELDYAGGKGAGTAEIDLREYPEVDSKFNIRFTDIEAGRALVRMHSLGGLLKGTFSFATNGEAITGPGIDPLSMLSAAGNATSTSGVLDLSGFLAPVSSALNIDLSNLETVDFRNWNGSYFIKDGRLATEDWQIVSKNGNWDIAGSFGFDGSLDYRARLVIPPAVQAGMTDLRKYGDLVDLFKDGSGNIVLDFDIGGSAQAPKFHLDQTAAKAKAGQKLIDNLKEGGVDKLKSLFKKKKK